MAVDHNKQLIIVNYKSEAKKGRVDKKGYLQDPFHETNKIQMNFIAYLLSGMGFSVHPILFSNCNAKRDEEEFNKTMCFDEYLVPYKWINDQIESRLDKMVALMNQLKIPE